MKDRVPALSVKEHVILELLGKSREMYGLELVTESAGALKRGTVYVTLGRMEEKGYVTSRAEEESPAQGGLPRRVYRSTSYGRELLAMLASARRRLSLRFAR
jgi:PadR family transcriptional regulator PadR